MKRRSRLRAIASSSTTSTRNFISIGTQNVRRTGLGREGQREIHHQPAIVDQFECLLAAVEMAQPRLRVGEAETRGTIDPGWRLPTWTIVADRQSQRAILPARLNNHPARLGK